MPSAATRFFGPVEYAPEDVIRFPAALPPFADARFLLLSSEARQPLAFLQSLDNAGLCFVTVPVRTIEPDYAPQLDPEDLALLEWEEPGRPGADDLTCLAILTVPPDGPVTANLLAPVVIHASARVGVQAVRPDALYSHAHLLPHPREGGPASAGH